MAWRPKPPGYRSGFSAPVAPTFSPFTPYGTPPTGSYDPALDAQVGAANRGLFDLGQDTQTQQERLGTDYNLQRGNILQGQDRGLADLQTGATRATEDHQQALDMLNRSFQQLAGQQRQQQARAGVIGGGGAALQAAAKRQSNETIQQQPIDTAFQRTLADNSTQQTRLGEDTQSQLGQLALQMAPPDANNPLGGRSFQDLTTTLTRAQREGGAFGLDTAAEKAYQASGAGWDPGAKPSNEYVGPQGPYRLIKRNGVTYRVDPSGKPRSVKR